jgi:methyl-accepting chemotaxis protein
VFKELDFATSLLEGPYRNTGLADAFRKANASNDPDFTYLTDFAPYYPSYENQAAFIASPIFESGRKLGVLIFQMPVGKINEMMTFHQKWREAGLGETGQAFIVGSDQTYRSQSRKVMTDLEGHVKYLRDIGTVDTLVREIESKQSSLGLEPRNIEPVSGALRGESGNETVVEHGVSKLVSFAPLDVSDVRWAIVTEMDENEALRSSHELLTTLSLTMLGLFLALAVVAVAASIWVGRSIGAPIAAMISRLQKASSQNDLTARLPMSSSPDLNELGSSLNQFFEYIHLTMQESKSVSDTVVQSMRDMTADVANMMRMADQQKSEAEQVASAVTEMIATIQDIAASASQAADAVVSADKQADICTEISQSLKQQMESLTKRMDEVQVSTRKLADDSVAIGAILDVIQNIAEQTNLLALNAAIEAARAGDQGRGFAVVADEVRSLATKTRESTEKIREQIETLQDGSRSSLDSVEVSNGLVLQSISLASNNDEQLQEISRMISHISQMNSQVAAASEEQSVVAEEINQKIVSISDASTLVFEKSTALEMRSKQLNDLAEKLKLKSEVFRL